ncbi:MAG: hypothetical protein ACJ789_07975 [Thermomicrobiales bacterium]
MKLWSWIFVVIAAVGIVVLIVYGDDSRRTAGREREGVDERAAQELAAMPELLGPDTAISVVLQQPNVPQDIAGPLDQARQLLAAAASQSPDQAKTTYGQARDQVHSAIDSLEKSADDESNDVTRIRLLRFAASLKAIDAVIERRQESL